MWVFVRSLRPHIYGYFWDFFYLLCNIEGIVVFVGWLWWVDSRSLDSGFGFCGGVAGMA